MLLIRSATPGRCKQAIPPVSSMISLLDFLFLLGAGVPESGIVEVNSAWIGYSWKGQLEDEQALGKVRVYRKAALLNLGLRPSGNKISSDFQRSIHIPSNSENPLL